jgi:hypothetical protein
MPAARRSRTTAGARDGRAVERPDERPPGNARAARKPGALGPLVAALREAGSRDVVAMMVCLTGVDAPRNGRFASTPTDDERRLPTAAALLAEPGAPFGC